MSTFSTDEYKARLERTKTRMAESGIDVLLLADPANMNYLSGYDGWSFYVPQVLMVALEDDQPTWIGRMIDANGARLTAWIDSDHIRWYTDEYVQSDARHPMDVMCAIVDEMGYGRSTIGVEMDAYYFTARAYERLTHGLPNATFRDANLLVNWVRLIKSPAEIELMRRAAEIAGRVMDTAITTIAEGVRGCDAAAAVYAAEIRGTEAFGGDYTAIMPTMPAGARTAAAHLSWTDKPYENGETVVLELAGCHQRYHAPLARTLVIGQSTRELDHLADVTAEGINTALGVVKAGVTCEDVERAWRQSIAKHGFSKESRLGYPTGINYPPDWGEHTASLRAGDRTILQPDMVFHMIAGMWQDNNGLEMSETFRVTADGCEVLTNFPRQLFVR